MQIEVNYKNPAKPLGVVTGKPTIPLNTEFSFFSNDGKLEIQFIGDSPVGNDKPPRRIADHTPLKAIKPGSFKFHCFINGKQVPEAIGGEILVPDGLSGN